MSASGAGPAPRPSARVSRAGITADIALAVLSVVLVAWYAVRPPGWLPPGPGWVKASFPLAVFGLQVVWAVLLSVRARRRDVIGAARGWWRGPRFESEGEGVGVVRSRQSHRLPGEAARPPRWRVAVDVALLGLAALAVVLWVVKTLGWPAPVADRMQLPRWAQTTWLFMFLCWVGYRATMAGPVARWLHGRRTARRRSWC